MPYDMAYTPPAYINPAGYIWLWIGVVNEVMLIISMKASAHGSLMNLPLGPGYSPNPSPSPNPSLMNLPLGPAYSLRYINIYLSILYCEAAEINLAVTL